ncbi:MAG TPA: hypothetical protein VF331_27050 [Polyangiales bacterium]
MPDEILWKGMRSCVLGELPLPGEDVVVACPDEHALSNTACWRGYVPTWKLTDGKLFLVNIRGNQRLAASEPQLARWVTRVFRGAAGPIERSASCAYATRYRRAWEIDLRSGQVHRERLLDCPTNMDSPAWEELPRTRALFARTTDMHPLAGRPVAADFRQPRQRARCRATRTDGRLGPADVVERMGRKRADAGHYVEWERGEREMSAANVAGVFRTLGLDATLQDELARADEEDHRAALVAFEAAPIEPTLVLGDGRHLYVAPRDVGTDAAQVLACSRACVAASWRPGRVFVTRSSSYEVDLDGNVRD